MRLFRLKSKPGAASTCPAGSFRTWIVICETICQCAHTVLILVTAQILTRTWQHRKRCRVRRFCVPTADQIASALYFKVGRQPNVCTQRFSTQPVRFRKLPLLGSSSLIVTYIGRICQQICIKISLKFYTMSPLGAGSRVEHRPESAADHSR